MRGKTGFLLPRKKKFYMIGHGGPINSREREGTLSPSLDSYLLWMVVAILSGQQAPTKPPTQPYLLLQPPSSLSLPLTPSLFPSPVLSLSLPPWLPILNRANRWPSTSTRWRMMTRGSWVQDRWPWNTSLHVWVAATCCPRATVSGHRWPWILVPTSLSRLPHRNGAFGSWQKVAGFAITLFETTVKILTVDSGQTRPYFQVRVSYY